MKLAAQTAVNKIRTTEFPEELSVFLKDLVEVTNKKYPDLTYGVVANFVFLRFICIAFTRPHIYGLCKDSPDEQSLRFLVLTAKVIQNLGFGVHFEKEGYMMEMNDFITKNKEAMLNWLREISDGEEYPMRSYHKVEITEAVRTNCLKWLYAIMYQNRQVIRRELSKKLKHFSVLEEIGVLRSDNSEDSFSHSVESISKRESKESKSASTKEDESEAEEKNESDESK